MNSDSLPFELQELERLLNKPNSDASGLASFFAAGEIWATRVPARLDVMGGIADYSGANVCESVLGRGVLMGLQARTDRTLRIRTMHAGMKALPIETRLPLDCFKSGDGLASYSSSSSVSCWRYFFGWRRSRIWRRDAELPSSNAAG